MRSKTPPCPGNIFEKSLVPRVLFIIDLAKSPDCEQKAISKPQKKPEIYPICVKISHKNREIKAVINSAAYVPTTVFEGETI